MASLRAYLLDLTARIRVKARLGRSPDIARIRAVFAQNTLRPSPSAVFHPGELGGVPGEWVRPRKETEAQRPHLLYLHGGGFVGGSPLTHRTITAAFARADFRVFVPDYRLAPEHPFPAGLEDIVAAWTAFSREGPAVVAGDSAGGNLALALIVEARRRGLPLPAAAALFSPACDLLRRGPSFRSNQRRDAMFTTDILANLAPVYLAGADPRDPRVSPVEADFLGFPPLLVHAAEREVLRDDSVALAEKARAAGVRVELTLWPVVPHVWQIADNYVPEARRSIEMAAAFLHREFQQAAAVPERVPA
ncbi:alpha/beta hydrolase [Methylobacterium gnaphalii]|uniref:Hydrolase n=1 Tax=Methylobacterium gnaphalii TaxID=1010610 RepID=A0A512JHL4_9HYPH|nr:alpha/beta hydrolase [Methylobacterium gnaphalii]GEP09457.1 hydrolase [Methylobacterium gnaphalii]GJD68064.1 Monoterpene epsilon-lactone hydrolase [Methylobacterium gnaphalii]GLS49154.1 hydrolase [Methylobacterium gnaphalii]